MDWTFVVQLSATVGSIGALIFALGRALSQDIKQLRIDQHKSQERFEQKFNKIDRRFENLEKKVDQNQDIAKNLAVLTQEVRGVFEKITEIQKDMHKVKEDQVMINQKIILHDEQFKEFRRINAEIRKDLEALRDKK